MSNQNMDNSGVKGSQIQSQVRVHLITRQPDMSLPEQTGPILVNTSKPSNSLSIILLTALDLRRYALSTLVNALLQNEKPTPFEFLINGTFLRTSIHEYLTAHGISSETVLTVEYVKAIIPPNHISSLEHDDWVSSVDVLSNLSLAAQWAGNGDTIPKSGHARILSGSYDGLLRVWNLSSEVLATSPLASNVGPMMSIKTARFISPTSIASAGMDRAIRIWKYDEKEDGLSASLHPQLEFYGHRNIINAIAVHAPSSRILSASFDQSVGVWSTDESRAPPAPAALLPPMKKSTTVSKRQKLKTTSTPTPQHGPLTLLQGHSGHVMDTTFDPNNHQVAYSVSMDHTLRTWDLLTSSLVDTRTSSQALCSVCALSSLHLIAVGGSPRNITLIDPRASAAAISAMTLRGHTNMGVGLARNPNSEHGLLSGSHDGTCRIWDVRSSRKEKDGAVGDSLYTILRESETDKIGGGAWKAPVGGEGGKVFGVCWVRDVGLVSGCED